MHDSFDVHFFVLVTPRISARWFVRRPFLTRSSRTGLQPAAQRAYDLAAQQGVAAMPGYLIDLGAKP
jgi:hypothetical protein